MNVIQLDSSNISLLIPLAETTWLETYTSILSNEQLGFMLNEIYNEASLNQQISEGQQFYLFSQNDRNVGFASGSMVDKNRFKLNKIYLLAEAKGAGCGKFMLDYMQKVAVENGANEMTLNVNINNPTLGFYTKMGFEIIKREDIPIGDFWMNDYVMLKKLSI